MCRRPPDGMLHYTEIFHGGKTLKQNMIKYFSKNSLGGSDRVVRRKEMMVSCRRKYSAALVVDLYECTGFFFLPLCLNHVTCLPDALTSQHLA